MTENTGKVVSINGNLLSVEFDGTVSMNEICYVMVDGTALKSEVIRIRGNIAQVQVYEMTDGIQRGDAVQFTGDMLSAQLGPGLEECQQWLAAENSVHMVWKPATEENAKQE